MIGSVDTASTTGLPFRRPSLFWGVIILILLASVPLHLGSPTADVSWLITMCERMLAGETAYVDLLEISPPVPMLLYMPPVIVGQIFDVSPERALVTIVYLAGFFILVLTGWILPQGSAEQTRSARTILLAASVMLFVAPADAFAQREYFATLFAIPMVAVFIRHALSGEWPPISARVIATVLAALTIAIKPPFFALPGAVIFGYYLWRTRDPMFVIASGFLTAGLLAVVITVATLAWFPDYFGLVWTLINDVYLPTNSHPLAFLTGFEAIAVLLALAITLLLQIKQRHSRSVWLLLSAGIGFLAAYFIQGKYFNYHAYPPALFIYSAFALAVVERISSLDSSDRAFRAALSMVLASVSIALPYFMYIGMRNDNPRVSDLSWAANLKDPSVMAISPIIATSFPFVREFGGVWVDRTHSQWVANFTHFMLAGDEISSEVRQLMIRHHKNDLVWLLESIEKNKPDVILVNIGPGYSWMITELEELKPHFLDGYTAIADEGLLRVMVRLQ